MSTTIHSNDATDSVFCTFFAKAEDAAKKLDRPGVVLTFDDAFVSQWLAAMPIFEEYNARATFFITQFDKLNEKQIAGLKKLKAAGHAIGCHGLRHLKAVDTVKKSSAAEYLKVEIEPAVSLMEKAGFRPTCFAYPNSQRDEKTDAALSKYFRHLRGGTMIGPGQTMVGTEAIFTPLDSVASRLCFIGTGLDNAGTVKSPAKSFENIFAALDRAAKRNEIVVFYAHNISDEEKGHHITPAALKKILTHAAEAKLAFYTYDDLPFKQ